mgnify:CR=1 FL=1
MPDEKGAWRFLNVMAVPGLQLLMNRARHTGYMSSYRMIIPFEAIKI